MQLERPHLTVLLNALYDLDVTTLSVSHPCEAIGELLRIDLDDPQSSTVRFTQGALSYGDTLEEIHQEFGDSVREDLPDQSHYVRAMVAGGLVDIENREAVTTFLHRYGYPDLEEGHKPVIAGIDTNLLPWRMPDVLGIDPVTGERDDDGRPPLNGYALATGIKAELDMHYKHYETKSLQQAFGNEFDRLTDQPAGPNRQGFLGLYEYRRLLADRMGDVVDCGRGDDEIIAGYRDHDQTSRKRVLLFSNDHGFVENAQQADLRAQHVSFPVDLPNSVTATWREIEDTLYVLSIIFGVLTLPKATLYGVWNGKSGKHWQNEILDVDARSPKLPGPLERDKRIIRIYESL